MHNVLECYSRKLSRTRKNEKPAGDLPKKIAEEQALSPETSRQATMAKISRQVLDKVTDVVALSLFQESRLRNRLNTMGMPPQLKRRQKQNSPST